MKNTNKSLGEIFAEIEALRKEFNTAIDGMLYKNKHDPRRQAIGKLGAGKHSGSRVKTPKREHGTVNVKNMTVEEKRAYWRLCDRRRRERASGKQSGFGMIAD